MLARNTQYTRHEIVRLFLSAIALLALWPRSSLAHPHVWIAADVALQFHERKIDAMQVTWIFDDVFTETTIEDFGKHKSGALDVSELNQLVEQSTKSLKNYSFFTHLQIDGKRRNVSEVRDFTAELRDQLLVYHFTVPIEPPVDPKTQSFQFLLYDETYYVYLAMAEGHKVTFRGDAPAGCKESRTTDKTTPLYFGYDYPTLIRISCP